MKKHNTGIKIYQPFLSLPRLRSFKSTVQNDFGNFCNTEGLWQTDDFKQEKPTVGTPSHPCWKSTKPLFWKTDPLGFFQRGHCMAFPRSVLTLFHQHSHFTCYFLYERYTIKCKYAPFLLDAFPHGNPLCLTNCQSFFNK